MKLVYFLPQILRHFPGGQPLQRLQRALQQAWKGFPGRDQTGLQAEPWNCLGEEDGGGEAEWPSRCKAGDWRVTGTVESRWAAGRVMRRAWGGATGKRVLKSLSLVYRFSSTHLGFSLCFNMHAFSNFSASNVPKRFTLLCQYSRSLSLSGAKKDATITLHYIVTECDKILPIFLDFWKRL